MSADFFYLTAEAHATVLAGHASKQEVRKNPAGAVMPSKLTDCLFSSIFHLL